MVSLSLHRTDTRLHPDQPLDHLPVLIAVVREADLVILIVLLTEVELDGSAFEDPLGFAGGGVYYCWDAAVRYFTYSPSANILDRRHGVFKPSSTEFEKWRLSEEVGERTVDLQKPLLFLLIFRYVNLVRGVLQTKFFEGT